MFAVRVVFRTTFEEKNKHRPDPKDWVADDCWIFITEAGQPLEFESRTLAASFATTMLLEWPEIRELDARDAHEDPPIAWMVVEIKEGEETWLI